MNPLRINFSIAPTDKNIISKIMKAEETYESSQKMIEIIMYLSPSPRIYNLENQLKYERR